MRGDRYQITLIGLSVVVTGLFGAFLWREMFPEYKIYQDAYIDLEEFRSTYTGEPPPPFTKEIKQILLPGTDRGPEKLDRCTSCHVAVQFEHFSPTIVEKNSQGGVVYNEKGEAVQITNPNYIWTKLDEKIVDLRGQGKIDEADRYESLKIAQVGEHTYDMTKVLKMHPLIGRETRPFEFHPIDEYGCTVCHGGNGRGLTTEKAHGPVFDGEYEVEFMGPKKEFTESDKDNDPVFSRVFNDKPGHALLFQTTPILVGNLIEAKCAQCHDSGEFLMKLNSASANSDVLKSNRSNSDFLKSDKQSDDQISSLLNNYHRGQELYISQACYACHRINGLARGGIGPELTYEGNSYPWFIKESMVWPQADLKTSTMPNFHLDHKELEELMTFLLAQKGRKQSESETDYRSKTLAWEAGAKLPWEKPINPGKLRDLHYSMTVFATEGCAACHRLKGFESSVGYTIEKGNQEKNIQDKNIQEENIQEENNQETRINAQENQKNVLESLTLEKKTPSQSNQLNQSDWAALNKEREWFKKLFPEMIIGSELVKVIEKNAKEIDARISDHVKEEGLLDRLEEEYPDLIASFNTPFRYALRSKNHYYQQLIDKEIDQIKKEQLKAEWNEWKKRVNRILMVYVQEYGLGRLIGPRPNWAGVYRSDEWLIEHFRKPSRHVARSIMPVMPFDDSKFIALTYMLDVLGQKNRDSVRAIWEHQGFNPETAYNIFCSQCHGQFLHGNGPVAEWIYPIPKNLRNADFLRNFTKDNVIASIVHGVKGTPMPPWGETPMDKPMADGIPVLTEHETKQLVDWIFSSLLGGTVIKEDEEVNKWQYDPKDLIEDLRKEGGELNPGAPPEFIDLEEVRPDVSYLVQPLGVDYLVSLKPLVGVNHLVGLSNLFGINHLASKNKETDETSTPEDMGPVSEYFDIYPNPTSGGEKYLYYIKKNYYTKKNLVEGQRYFELNCVVCHGKEADGSGYRAGTMYDAKPRMLTNLHWVDSRDDLRLLRSLKYGVPGTSMVPWGDQTSTLQRLQLVMYIRSLSFEQQQRDNLFNSLYEVFDRGEQMVDTARIDHYQKINKIQAEINQLNLDREKFLQKFESKESDISDSNITDPNNSDSNNVDLNNVDPMEAVKLYKRELELKRELKKYEESDKILVNLKDLIKKESQIYQNLGIIFISKTFMGNTFDKYLSVIALNKNDYQENDGRFVVNFDQAKEDKIKALEKELIKRIDEEIRLLEKEKLVIEGKLPSLDKKEQLESLNNNLQGYKKLKANLISGFEEALRLRQEQLEEGKKLGK